MDDSSNKAKTKAAFEYFKKHWKVFASVVTAVVLIIAIMTIVHRTTKYPEIESENKELQTTLAQTSSELETAAQQLDEMQKQLDEAKKQNELYRKSANALKEQVSELNIVNEDLNNQLENLLHVEEQLPVITRNQMQEQLTSISELVSKKYEYRNAAEKEDSKAWLWGWTMPFSGTRLIALYDGTIKAGVDLKEIKIDINEQDRVITVTIPPSRILDHNIPQETINVVEVKNNLFNEITFNDYNKFISAEKVEMEKAAIERGLLKEADKENREIIKVFLGAMPGMDTYTLKFN